MSDKTVLTLVALCVAVVAIAFDKRAAVKAGDINLEIE